MKKRFFCLHAAAISIMVIFSNCQKEALETSSSDYSPLTAGSSWTYSDSGGGSSTLTATNRDTVANGKTYRVLTNSSGSNNYLGKSGNEYYRFGAITELGISGVEELYLKDNEAVNGTWSTAQTFNVPGIPIPLVANLKYSVVSKGGDRVVSGKTYKNVIQIRLDISVLGVGNLGGGDFYYAAGIGMIENTISVTIPGQAAIVHSQLLTSYEIK